MPVMRIIYDKKGHPIGTAPIESAAGTTPFERRQGELGNPTFSPAASGGQYSYVETRPELSIVKENGRDAATATIRIFNRQTGQYEDVPATQLTEESRSNIQAYERRIEEEKTEAAMRAKALRAGGEGMTSADVAHNIRSGYYAAVLESGRAPPGLNPARAIGLWQPAAAGKILTPAEYLKEMNYRKAVADTAEQMRGDLAMRIAVAYTTDPYYAAHIGSAFGWRGAKEQAQQSEYAFIYEYGKALEAGKPPLLYSFEKTVSSPVVIAASFAAVGGEFLGALSYFSPGTAKAIITIGAGYLGLKEADYIAKGEYVEALRMAESLAVNVPIGIAAYKGGYQAASGVPLNININSPLKYEKVTWKDATGKELTIERDVFWQTSQGSEPVRLIGKENTGSLIHGWKGPFNQNWELSGATLNRIGLDPSQPTYLHGVIETRIALSNYKSLFFPKDASTLVGRDLGMLAAKQRLEYTIKYDKMMYKQPSEFSQSFGNIARLENPEKGTKVFLEWAARTKGEGYGSAFLRTQLPEGTEWYSHDVDWQSALSGKRFDRAVSDLIAREAEVGNYLTPVKTFDIKTGTASTQLFNPAGEKVFDIHPLQKPMDVMGLGFRYGQTPVNVHGTNVKQMPMSEGNIRYDTMANPLPTGMPAAEDLKVIWRAGVLKSFLSKSAGGKGADLAAAIRSTYSKPVMAASYAAAGGKVSVPISFLPSQSAISIAASGSLPSLLSSSISFSASMPSLPGSSPSRSSPSASKSPSMPSSPSSRSLSPPSFFGSPSASAGYPSASLSSPSLSPSSPPSASISYSPSSPSKPPSAMAMAPMAPPPVPPINMGFGSGFKIPAPPRLKKRKYAYSPSVTSIIMNIRGKMPKQKIFTGAEIRPIPIFKGRRKR